MNQTGRPFLEFDMLSGNEVSRANTFGVEASLPENPLPKVGIPRPLRNDNDPPLRAYGRRVSPRLVALVHHSQYSPLGTRYPLPSFKRMFLLQFFHSRTPLVLKVICLIHQARCGFGILAVDPDQSLGAD
jgi:hypothetical protein